jgi:site-specific DNA-methyltransferase (adenine-specific)
MEAMKQMPDKAFDLAIVDPPYGITERSNRDNFAKGQSVKRKVYHQALWGQEKPSQEYFSELFRVSNNQIIWGGNYFIEFLHNTRCFIFWDKEMQYSVFADGELAWTSFNESARVFRFAWNGMIQGNMKNKEIRIHPTQKPVALYHWLLKNYAEPEMTILDTHLGSGSIAIACHDMCHDLTAFEIDKDYYDAAVRRLENHKKQMTLY